LWHTRRRALIREDDFQFKEGNQGFPQPDQVTIAHRNIIKIRHLQEISLLCKHSQLLFEKQTKQV